MYIGFSHRISRRSRVSYGLRFHRGRVKPYCTFRLF